MRKFGFILTLTISVLTSCINKDDCGPFPSEPYYVIDSIGTDFFSIYEPGVTATSPLNYDECVIDFIPYYHSEIAFNSNNSEWSLITKAQACSPPLVPESRGEINVFSKSVLYLGGETLPAGSNISAFMKKSESPERLDSTIHYFEYVNFIKFRNAPDSAIDADFYLRYREEGGAIFKSGTVRVQVNSN